MSRLAVWSAPVDPRLITVITRPPRRWRRLGWGLLLALPLRVTPAAPPDPEPLLALATAWLEDAARATAPQAQVTVQPPARATPLPACDAPQLFLPPGKRAWGKVSLGVRCDTPAWTLYLAAQVTVPGEYVVARRTLRAGEPVAAADLELRAGDLAALPDDTLTDFAQAEGLTPRHGLAARQPLRAGLLQRPPLIQQGQTVPLVIQGAGFQVLSAGVALNPAAAGETVRVRLESGKTVHAQTTADGRATLRP